MKIEQLKKLVREDLRIFKQDEIMTKNIMRNCGSKARPVAKNVQCSEWAKSEGNKLYSYVKHGSSENFRVLHRYNESIAFAPPKSEEMAKAYGNKSALLRRMLKFKHCITEADKALAITQSIPLKIKLLCRKAECFTALRSTENEKCVQKAQFLFKKLEDSDGMKETLSKLINGAQFLIDHPESGDFYDEKLFDTAQAQSSKMVASARKNTSIECTFEMKYNKKYGHHLVAARDFQPGEIICVEKPYHTQILDCKTPSYCSRCQNFLWTIVPCDFCSWYVYCSEHCKTENWNDYHDIECSPLQHMKEVLSLREFVDLGPVAIFFKALKEAGSIEKLEADLELMDKCEDHSGKNFMSDKKLLSYKTLCLVQTRKLTREDFQTCVRSASLNVIGLTNPVLKRNYDPYDIKKLIKDETAIFMGAFLCRLQIIDRGRIQSANQFDPAPTVCSKVPVNNAVVLTSLLTPISCVPNIEYCRSSDDNKFIAYAMQPIKAGDQLYTSIYLSSIYYNAPKSQRQINHKTFHPFPCHCPACVYDWDKILLNPAQAPSIPDAKFAVYQELVAELQSIKREMETSSLYKMKLVDSHCILRVRKLIVKAWEHFPMPSLFTLEVGQFMIQLFESFFPPHARIFFRLNE